MSAQAAWLPGGRLHLHHGPIDLVIGAEGGARCGTARRRGALCHRDGGTCRRARPAARARRSGRVPRGAIARRMHAAVLPFLPDFITPMAAVAGAVAEEILAAMCGAGVLERAYVNNGGDVALHLAPGQSFRAAIADGLGDSALIRAGDGVRGIATSGRGGRSFSLGIAESVTVLAARAAGADAAATMIANAVDLPGHPAIRRLPACEIAPESDLGARLVTVDVGALSAAETALALEAGAEAARDAVARGLIAAALLTLNGVRRVTGRPGLIEETIKEAIHA
ncbi:UPF0280 family protein [Seohaeicola zhoushanensis]